MRRKKGIGVNLGLPLISGNTRRVMVRKEKDLPDTHRTKDVVNHIRSLIENGTLHPGDKIPPEREFARSLKISRASLRTGIGYLETMGVIKVRHGVGTFVTDGPAEFGKSSFDLMSALHGFQPWQMFETRLIIESNLAALAAERGREEHHIALAEEVVEIFAAVDRPGDFLVHDVQFHRILSQASGNPILAAVMETITSALYDRRRKTAERSTTLRESAEMHRMIYRAIRARDPVEARKLMEQHLRKAQIAQGMERPTARKTTKTVARPKSLKADTSTS